MDLFSILRIVSGVLMIAGYLPNMWQVYRKTGDPLNQASLIVWAVFDGLTFVFMWFAGTHTFQIGACALMNFVLLGMSLRYGTMKWGWIEYICLGIAGFGLALWLMTKNPNFGMTCSLVAMSIGTIPMIKDAWNTPQGFSLWGWTCWWVSNLLAIVTVPVWEYAHYAQPIGFEVTATIIYILLWTRPRPLPEEQNPSSS